MTGKGKFVLALFGILLLLANPVCVCSAPSPHAPSHPCCPPPPAQHHSNTSNSCVCIEFQPQAPVLPSVDFGQSVASPAVRSSYGIDFRRETAPLARSSGFTPQSRFLRLRQILV